MSCLSFLEGILIQKVRETQHNYYIEQVHLRLDLQKEILDRYRSECDWENEVQCEYELSLTDYDCIATEEMIEVFNEHGMVIIKYDIIDDGSVIETIMEEIL